MNPVGNRNVWILPLPIWPNQKTTIGIIIWWLFVVPRLTVNRIPPQKKKKKNGNGMSNLVDIVCMFIN